MREHKFEHNLVTVYIDEGMECWNSISKYPYYRLRGKPVTPAQASEIIGRTDDFFGTELDFETFDENEYFQYLEDVDEYKEYLGEYVEYLCSEKRYLGGFHCRNDWFQALHGWSHPDGTIGINAETGVKYPETYELYEEWAKNVKFIPYLDLVIAMTSFSKPLLDAEQYEFEDRISIGVWVHDGIVEITDAERAADLYKEYDKLYADKDQAIFEPDYYVNNRQDIISLDYLYRCLKAYSDIKLPEELIKTIVHPLILENSK